MTSTRIKQLNLLGLAFRAGYLVSGDELTQAAIKAGQAQLVICAKDVSPKTLERYQGLSQRHHVSLVTDYSSEELSQAIGRLRKLMAITNAGMAQTFISYENGVTDMHE